MSTSHAVEHDENQILLGARLVREYYYPKRKTKLPDWVLIFAIKDLLKSRPGTLPDELYDVLIGQTDIKSQGHLSRYLAATIVSDVTAGDTGEADTMRSSVFTGGRKFSFEKISAMAAYITYRGRDICKNKLDKLLFYGDFVNYYLYGISISGAKYVRHRFGPVMDHYESILKTLEYTGTVQRSDGCDGETRFTSHDDSMTEILTVLETVSLYWVLANFGSMTASELNQISTREIAHRFTRQDDYIAYEYAKLLRKLPERSEL